MRRSAVHSWMRIRVADILELDAAGLSSAQILADSPDLEAEDLEAVRKL